MAPFEHAIQILEYGRIREILSAYAESVLGRKLAAQLRPCPDGEELRRLHAETRELGELLESARLPLAGLSDVCSGLEDNDSGGKPLEPEHLYRVVDLLRSGLGIREAFCRDEGTRHQATGGLVSGDRTDVDRAMALEQGEASGHRPARQNFQRHHAHREVTEQVDGGVPLS